MRLSPSFPTESDWKKWVIFDSGSSYVALTILERLGAYARDVLKRPLHLISGFRTYEQQMMLWNNYKYHGGPYANPPGYSWHEFSCAVDVHGPKTLWAEIIRDYYLPPDKQLMRKYGLYIKSWAGTSVDEWWHLMPSEIIGYTGERKDFLLDDEIYGDDEMKQGDNGPNVLSWQNALVAEGSWAKGSSTPPAPNSNFGPYTATCTNIFKKSKSLPEDGIVDETTFCKMLDTLRMLEDPELEEAKKEVDRLQGLIDDYNKALTALK